MGIRLGFFERDIESTGRLCSSARPPWTAAGLSPDGDSGHDFQIQGHREVEGRYEMYGDYLPWPIAARGRRSIDAAFTGKNRET